MLNSLKVLNGEMALKFDSLNNIYTIRVDDKQDMLELEYDYSEGYEVSVFGNVLDNKYNEVVISVYNDSEVTSYYLEVYKSEASKVIEVNEDISTLEVREEVPSYQISLIGSVCFLFILLFFTLLFKKVEKTKR